MTLAQQDTVFRAARTPGDLVGRIEAAMVDRARTVLPTFTAAEDQRGLAVCRAIIDGNAPASWVRMMLALLDVLPNNLLAAPEAVSDAQISGQMATAFARFIASR